MSEVGGEFETAVHGCMMDSGEFKDALHDCKLEFGEFAAMHDCKSDMIEFDAEGHGCMLESRKFGASLHEKTPLRRVAEALHGMRRAVPHRVRPVLMNQRSQVVSDSFASLFDCCESPSTRFHRVTSILHDNSPFACFHST